MTIFGLNLKKVNKNGNLHIWLEIPHIKSIYAQEEGKKWWLPYLT